MESTNKFYSTTAQISWSDDRFANYALWIATKYKLAKQFLQKNEVMFFDDNSRQSENADGISCSRGV